MKRQTSSRLVPVCVVGIMVAPAGIMWGVDLLLPDGIGPTWTTCILTGVGFVSVLLALTVVGLCFSDRVEP